MRLPSLFSLSSFTLTVLFFLVAEYITRKSALKSPFLTPSLVLSREKLF